MFIRNGTFSLICNFDRLIFLVSSFELNFIFIFVPKTKINSNKIDSTFSVFQLIRFIQFGHLFCGARMSTEAYNRFIVHHVPHPFLFLYQLLFLRNNMYRCNLIQHNRCNTTQFTIIIISRYNNYRNGTQSTFSLNKPKLFSMIWVKHNFYIPPLLLHFKTRTKLSLFIYD